MNELHKFLFDGLPVRGMLVRLGDAWTELLARRVATGAFAAPVRGLLGEMAAAGVLMRASLKFDGALILQVTGDGPVKLAVAEVQADLSLRATASVHGAVPSDAGLQAMVNAAGQGRCVITLDPKQRFPGQQPYQGVVPLYGDHREPLQRLAQVLEHYMLQSEQLDTKLVLAANDTLAAGLLIQRLPVDGEANLAGRRNQDEIGLNEGYKRIALLASTLTAGELLGLGADAVLHRLFWQEPLRRFERPATEPVPHFACPCSRERVARMLQGLGRAEFDSLIAERGLAEVTCEFCGAQYRFDAVDGGELFTAPIDQPPSPRSVQ